MRPSPGLGLRRGLASRCLGSTSTAASLVPGLDDRRNVVKGADASGTAESGGRQPVQLVQFVQFVQFVVHNHSCSGDPGRDHEAKPLVLGAGRLLAPPRCRLERAEGDQASKSSPLQLLC